MKHLLIITLTTILFFACNSGTEETYPEDLAGKKTLLKEKRTELKEIAALVEQLQTEIEEMDSSIVKKLPLVTTMPVRTTDFAHFTDIQGVVEANDLVAISSETGGRIIQLSIDEGSYVRKGQLVGKVDLESVEKQIVELETQLELADELYERQKRLWDQKIGTEVQLLQAENNKKRLEKSLETIKVQLNKAEFYAPAAGVVEMLNVKQGEVAGPGAPIAMILNTSSVKITADLPETLIQAVQKGQSIEAEIPALGWQKMVRITEIARTIDPTNRTLKVEAMISNPSGKIKPNLLASMKIKDLALENVVTIPVELLQQEVGGKDFVYIVENGQEGKVAKKIYVETGESYNNQIVITDGLRGGESIVVKGSRSVANNEAVDVTKAATES